MAHPRLDLRKLGKGKLAVCKDKTPDPYMVARDIHVLLSRVNDLSRFFNLSAFLSAHTAAPGGASALLQITNFANANRFSSICDTLLPDGNVTNCDPGSGHNSDFVNTAMCAYASIFDDGGKTTGDLRREALEEAVSTTIQNTRVYQESLGVYTLLFLTGNFPNPLTVK